MNSNQKKIREKQIGKMPSSAKILVRKWKKWKARTNIV
jgi:hypothetical protein